MACGSLEKTSFYPCEWHFLRVLQNMYANIKSCVTVNGQDSQFFNSNRGVRHGNNLSSVPFSLFLNDLEDHLLADQVNGIPIEYKTDDFVHFIKIFILLYADDTTILSDSAKNLQKSLDSFLKYYSDWKLQLNETKTKVVLFGARKTNSYLFKLGNSPLEIVDNYKYLGTVFSKTRSFFKARKHIAEQARKDMHLLQMRIENLNLPVDLQLKLFDQTILPIMTYSCKIFGFEDCGLFEKIHTHFLRSIIQARKSTPLFMVYGELGRYPIEITIKTRMINYWSRLINGKHSKLAFILYRKMRATDGMHSNWVLKIQRILEECGLTYG